MIMGLPDKLQVVSLLLNTNKETKQFQALVSSSEHDEMLELVVVVADAVAVISHSQHCQGWQMLELFRNYI